MGRVAKHRRSLRLREYDYSRAGAYFVTVCAEGRGCFFGQVSDGRIELNDAGCMIDSCWNQLRERSPNLDLDQFVVMPNHIHGIVVILGEQSLGAQSGAQAVTLGSIVGAFKSITTDNYVNGVESKDWTRFDGRLWQRNYYEHVIRDAEQLGRIREYIDGNPGSWATDEENPDGATHSARQRQTIWDAPK